MPGLVAPSNDETTLLLGYLAQQRYVITITTYGLTDEQIRLAPSVSPLCIGSLIKHLTAVERSWMDTVRGHHGGSAEEYDSNFRLAEGDTLATLLADYRAAAAETEATVKAIGDLDHPVPVPHEVPWFPADVDAWSVRWVLLHLATETARHAGHADIVRESIDGATGFPLLAAVEGWPETPWLQPWRPAA
jgi:hypothetical protein